MTESSDLSSLPSLTLCCPPAQSCADPVKTIRQNSLSRHRATMSCLNPASPTVKAFGQPYAKYMVRNYTITIRFRHGRLSKDVITAFDTAFDTEIAHQTASCGLVTGAAAQGDKALKRRRCAVRKTCMPSAIRVGQFVEAPSHESLL